MFEPLNAHRLQGTKVGNILEREHIQSRRKRQRQNLRTALREGSGMDQIMEHLLHLSHGRESGKDGR